MNSGLNDPFGRGMENVHLSVTDRCDLRCFYCLPGDDRDFSEPERHEFTERPQQIVRFMARTGG